MGNKQKAKIDEQNNKIAELNLRIDALSLELENEKIQSKNSIQAKELAWESQDKTKSELSKTQINELNLSIDKLKSELANKQNQLDRKELKKLAEAFSEQEEANKKDQKIWLISLCATAGILVVYAIISIFITANKPWSERITYYVIDGILVSSVWFCISQFSESTKLKHDYGNRKTLAQTFNNILNNLAEDIIIKNKFIEKTTDILCAPVGVNSKEPVLTKKILKDIAEIIGSVNGK